MFTCILAVATLLVTTTTCAGQGTSIDVELSSLSKLIMDTTIAQRSRSYRQVPDKGEAATLASTSSLTKDHTSNVTLSLRVFSTPTG